MFATLTPVPATVTTVVATDAMAVESRIVREVRRNSDSLRAQHLWDAIRAVRAQKQIQAMLHSMATSTSMNSCID